MGALHAVALLTCIGLTELACRRYRRSPSNARALGAVAAGVVLALVAAGLGLHQCDRGIPVQQWAIPSICLAIGLGLVGHRQIRRWLAAALSMIAIVGTLHYAALVHTDVYLGRSTPALTAPGKTPRATWHTPLTGLYRID